MNADRIPRVLRRKLPARRVILTISLSLAPFAPGCKPERLTSDPTQAGKPDLEVVDPAKIQALVKEYRELVDEYNVETGARQLSPATLSQWLAEGRDVVILDIREPVEHSLSHLPGARLLPPSNVESEAASIEAPPETPIVAYCTAGYRSGHAAVKLERLLGRPVYNLDGGIILWFNRNGKVVDPSGNAVLRVHPYGDEWARYVLPKRYWPRGTEGEPTGSAPDQEPSNR